MALDRWVALVILCVCLAYGYAAWFVMDDLLPPILKQNPIWPSSFPKVLAVGGIIVSALVLLGLEKGFDPETADINYRRLADYKVGQAVLLLGSMVAYALLLAPLGFLLATFLFLFCGCALLGEKRYGLVAAVSAIAAFGVWYLVEQVLSIFLRPFPALI